MQIIKIILVTAAIAIFLLNSAYAQRKKQQQQTPQDKREACEAQGFKYAHNWKTDTYECFNPADYTLVYPNVQAPKWKKTGGVRTATFDISDLQDMIIGPQGFIYVGLYNEGVYVSKDNGTTYQEISVAAKGWKDENATVAALHFTKEGVLFASADPYGIYRSKNNGDTWQLLSVKNGLPEYQGVLQIISLPGGTLFAAVEDNGIYRSKDNGEKWTRVTTGLPDKFDERKAILTVTEEGVYMMAEETNIPAERGIYVTTDKGDTWSMVADIPTMAKNFIINDDNESLTLECIVAVDNNNLVVGTNNGAMYSADKGQTWKMGDAGMHFYDYGTAFPLDQHKVIPVVERLTRDNAGNVYATCPMVGIFMSKDKGVSWAYLMEDRVKLRDVAAVAVSAQGYLFSANSGGDYRGYVCVSGTPVDQFQQVVLTPQ